MERIKVVPNPDDIYSSKGLSQLCGVLLGKPLNKDEQFSDWERRPLREGQIMYAGMSLFMKRWELLCCHIIQVLILSNHKLHSAN